MDDDDADDDDQPSQTKEGRGTPDCMRGDRYLSLAYVNGGMHVYEHSVSIALHYFCGWSRHTSGRPKKMLQEA